MIGGILGRIVNTVHNDVVNPISHLFGGGQPQNPGFTPAPMQKINLTQDTRYFGAPTIPAYQGNQARLNAQKQLQLTPAFAQNLMNAQPAVANLGATSALRQGAMPSAEYVGQQPINQILLNPGHGGYGEAAPTLLHEGLHRVYDSNPQIRQQFIQAYNQSATPALKNYLLARLYPYQGAAKGLDEGGVPIPNYNPNNLNTLPQNLQDEAHSFISETPSLGMKLPAPLANYYNRYFNTGAVEKSAVQRLESMRRR